MTLLRLTTMTLLLGFLVGFLTGWYARGDLKPPQLRPLGVTITSDGGADVKVESKVIEEGKK